jgi:hypothetical protein
MPDCQRKRRRHWQSKKRKNDPDYHDNQARAQQAWNKRNPDYWREYRKDNKAYRERNRALQRERNAQRNKSMIAKMDVSATHPLLPSGIYRLSRVFTQGIAKMDAWTVEITVLSGTSEVSAMIAKR